MFKKIKNWINLNKHVIYVILFLISIILSCFNLFTGLHNTTLTIIIFIILGFGYGIMIYDIKKGKKND